MVNGITFPHIRFIFGIVAIISLLFGSAVVNTVHATPVPVFGPLDHVYNLTIDNKSHPIRYGFHGGDGVVRDMYANSSSKSITVSIDDNSTSSGEKFFLIELPRNIVNANTTGIAGGCSSSPNNGTIWIQEHDMPYEIVVSVVSAGEIAVFNGSQNEECGPDTRILSIEYPSDIDSSTIIIKGTTMIPEFGKSLSALLLAMAIAGGLVTSTAIWSRVQTRGNQ